MSCTKRRKKDNSRNQELKNAGHFPELRSLPKKYLYDPSVLRISDPDELNRGSIPDKNRPIGPGAYELPPLIGNRCVSSNIHNSSSFVLGNSDASSHNHLVREGIIISGRNRAGTIPEWATTSQR